MSQRSEQFSNAGPAANGPCIDGVAEVIGRRRQGLNAAERSPESGQGPAFGRRQAREERPASVRLSGQRQAGTTRPAEANWAETVEIPFAGVAARAAAAGTNRRGAPLPGRIGLVACAFMFGALLLPVFMVSFPETPVAATASNGGGYAVRLATINASLTSHGDGKLLRVEGRITNPATAAAAIPPLRIDFADRSAGLRSRTLQTSVDHLGAGQSIDFITMIAMPEDAKGDVRVGFVGTAIEGDR
ncbi:hypothetical protein [Jiella pelagia]|uniref:DUF3426 domain-containing protein n=1 Tax=Jiella pelagia TaxID=2986949 RepID=A0ABY7BXB5_9HYPH|nr:hypothetical protein [Jiella pelagia]WAP68048.1 hypothetical protein OH818_22030 [Jiella pelagia]